MVKENCMDAACSIYVLIQKYTGIFNKIPIFKAGKDPVCVDRREILKGGLNI
jgi:hypothetical protein